LAGFQVTLIGRFWVTPEDIVGVRAVLVHAIDEQAKKFYLHFDFEPSPIHELQLMLLMKDLRKSLEE